MNRENKLAIIIGFSLVLVVAVLLSDHFSRARTAEAGGDITPAKAEDVGAGISGLTRALGGPESSIPVHTGPLTNVTPRIRDVSTETEISPDPTHQEIVMGPQPKGGTPGDVVDEFKENFEPVRGQREQREETLAIPAKPFSKGEMRTHEVKSGDKLFRIAAKYYGDGSLWEALAEYNKARVPNASVLRQGVRLDIPPKDVLLGEAVMPPAGSTPPKANSSRSAPERTGGRPDAEKAPVIDRSLVKNDKTKPEATKGEKEKEKKPAMTTYKVARGDDLSTIAQKLLGSAKRARELYQFNKDVLADEHTLIAGTVLKIPAR